MQFPFYMIFDINFFLLMLSSSQQAPRDISFFSLRFWKGCNSFGFSQRCVLFYVREILSVLRDPYTCNTIIPVKVIFRFSQYTFINASEKSRKKKKPPLERVISSLFLPVIVMKLTVNRNLSFSCDTIRTPYYRSQISRKIVF